MFSQPQNRPISGELRWRCFSHRLYRHGASIVQTYTDATGEHATVETYRLRCPACHRTDQSATSRGDTCCGCRLCQHNVSIFHTHADATGERVTVETYRVQIADLKTRFFPPKFPIVRHCSILARYGWATGAWAKGAESMMGGYIQTRSIS